MNKIKVTGNIRDEIEVAGKQLVQRGIRKVDRDYILETLNNPYYCESPLNHNELTDLIGELDEYNKDHESPYTLVRNSIKDGTDKTIMMCFAAIDWDFRHNDRGDILECDMGTEEYHHKDIKTWKSRVIGNMENHVMHSLNITILKDRQSKYNGIKIETPKFNFSPTKVIQVLECIQDEPGVDVWKLYLESPKIMKLVEDIESKYKHGKKIDDSKFHCKRVLREIMQFHKPKHEMKEFYECPEEYIDHLLETLMFPAVYSAYHPGESFGPVVVLHGSEGCFKTVLPQGLLPPHLQQQHCDIISFDDTDENIIRTYKKSVFAIFDEGNGMWKNAKKTKTILGRLKDTYVDKWHTTTLSFPRRCVSYIPSNDMPVLKLTPDSNRRYYPATAFQNEDLTKRGIEENKTDYLEYFYEWCDKYRDILWSEMMVYYRAGRKPGIPRHLDIIRQKMCRLASGLDGFKDDIREAFRIAAKTRNTIDYEDLFNNVPYDQNHDREIIIKQVHKELGGSGKLKKGRVQKEKDDGEGGIKLYTISRPHFDISMIDPNSTKISKDIDDTDTPFKINKDGKEVDDFGVVLETPKTVEEDYKVNPTPIIEDKEKENRVKMNPEQIAEIRDQDDELEQYFTQ